MRSLVTTVLVLWAASSPQTSLACSDEYLLDAKPTQSAKDCSFGGFGLDGNYAGHPVVDLGGGKVGQLIIAKQSCPYLEQLLFVDCTTSESVAVDGVLEPELQRQLDEEGAEMLGGDYLIKYIQPPIGPIGLTSEATVKSVVATAEKHKLTYSTAVLQSFAEHNATVLKGAEMAAFYDVEPAEVIVRRSKKRSANKPFDLYCGCKVYYPNSPGASQ